MEVLTAYRMWMALHGTWWPIDDEPLMNTFQWVGNGNSIILYIFFPSFFGFFFINRYSLFLYHSSAKWWRPIYAKNVPPPAWCRPAIYKWPDQCLVRQQHIRPPCPDHINRKMVAKSTGTMGQCSLWCRQIIRINCCQRRCQHRPVTKVSADCFGRPGCAWIARQTKWYMNILYGCRILKWKKNSYNSYVRWGKFSFGIETVSLRLRVLWWITFVSYSKLKT